MRTLIIIAIAMGGSLLSTGQDTVLSQSIDNGELGNVAKGIIEYEGSFYVVETVTCLDPLRACSGLIDLSDDLEVRRKGLIGVGYNKFNYGGTDAIDFIGSEIMVTHNSLKLGSGQDLKQFSIVSFYDTTFQLIDTLHIEQLETPDPAIFYARSGVAYNDSTFIVGGLKESDPGSTNTGHGWVRMLSRDGELIWEHTFSRGDHKSINIEGLDVFPNGDILVLLDISISSSAEFAKAVILDSTGAVVREHVVPDTIDFWRVPRATIVNDSLFGVSWYKTRRIQDFPDFQRMSSEINMIHRDSGSVWSYHILNRTYRNDRPSGGVTTIISILPTSDGGMLGVGSVDFTYALRYVSEQRPHDPWSAGYVIKLSPEGEMEWEKVISDARWVDYDLTRHRGNNFRDGVETKDGYILVGRRSDTVGVPTSVAPYNLNTWAVKIDKDGCVVGGDSCKILQNIGDTLDRQLVWVDWVPEPEPEPIDMVIYPNPTNGQMQVAFQEYRRGVLELYDLNGRKHIEKAVNGTKEEIRCMDCPSGMYILKYRGEKGLESAVEKVIIR